MPGGGAPPIMGGGAAPIIGGAGDMDGGVMAAVDPAEPDGGLLGHGKGCAPASSADTATNATTRGRQLALMMRDPPPSNEAPPLMAAIRYRTG
jgi:hypothetical protein